MNLVLIGYRGTGKTTVGRLAAERLGLAFLDADEELERRVGRTIREIFAEGGEQTFRDWETRILGDLLSRSDQVVSLGGGAILREQNRDMIRRPGNFVVWLTASPETIEQRITGDTTTAERRPNLTSRGGLAEIVELLERREPFYRDCADCTVAADAIGRTPQQIADDVVSLWRSRSA